MMDQGRERDAEASSRDETTSGGWEQAHRYGDRVHLLANVHILSMLARLSSDAVHHPEMEDLLRAIYQALILAAAGNELPRVAGEVRTRMAAQHPEAGFYRGPVLDPAARVVVSDVIRAGIVPAQTCFEMLARALPDASVRMDHLTLSRIADSQGRVRGAELTSGKIGGRVDGAVLMLPDPMGATGSTTLRVVQHYLEHHGRPARIVALPMIATPEYLRAVLSKVDNLCVYAARLDRGLSSPDVLASVPGTHWERERGLDEHGYIVPGAGGMGEVLSNSWC